MAGSGQPGNDAPAASPSRVAVVVAIVLIAVYITMLAVLAVLRADKEWDRLVYLLTGFEALVFAGTGALFGTTVQRANVTAARSDAANARNEAKEEHDRAQVAEKDAMAGRALATAVEVKARTRAGVSASIRGSRPDELISDTGLTGLDADL